MLPVTELVELTADDPRRPLLLDWLQAARLATADLAEADARFFVLPGMDGAPLAFAGLEGRGRDQLLRSVVVGLDGRRQGLGAQVVAAMEQAAGRAGAHALWLLTTDAAPFFTRLGYAAAERTDTPPVVAASRQFQGLCSASAALLRKALGDVAE